MPADVLEADMRLGIILWTAVSACTARDEFGGEEAAWSNPDGGSAENGTSVLAVTSASEQADASDSGGSALDATLEATGREAGIDVVHSGVTAHCCTEWGADVVAEDFVADVTYTDSAANVCEETCLWTLAYSIEGLLEGNWLVRAGGEQDGATVE